MTSTHASSPLGDRTQTIDLENGLIMRWSTAPDKDNLMDCLGTAFREEIFGEDGETPGKNEYIEAFVGWLMSGEHVVTSQHDFAFVEDTTLMAQPGKNPIVAVVALARVSGYFGPVDMQFGVVTAVGTLREYRNRGLVKKLMLLMIHPAADERGDEIVFILGIPHFYRQFGYECAVPYRIGRTLPALETSLPPLPAGDSEPFILQGATSADIPYLVRMSTPDKLYLKAQIGTYYDHGVWRLIVDKHSPEYAKTHHDTHHHASVILDSRTGQTIGFSLTSHILGKWSWEAFSIDEDVAVYRDVLPSVLRQLKAADRPYFESYSTKLNNYVLPDETDLEKRARGQFPPLTYTDLYVKLTAHHPATMLLAAQGKLEPAKDPYPMYTRIASLPKLVRKIAPVLERRLRGSAFGGISATLQINFYRKIEGMSSKGLEIVFERGQLKRASDWVYKSTEDQLYEAREKGQEPSPSTKGVVFKAHFAPLTFTRLVTGSTDVEELLKRDGENGVDGAEAKLLLSILFPKVEHFVEFDWW
ncbi:hypothetical protein KVV02_005384 [Mortierella alpina]|uniref:Uncharacterized protein n=1 Tax=Mortierella alpina TaxID=64518 RepID=A0A9P7ZZH4_MORAP|nr:hypothetical protein KVV02_005384 [Mortierella alpina]